MSLTVAYDDALPRFAAILAEEVGEDEVLGYCFLRDAAGKLTLLLKPETEQVVRERLVRSAKALFPWVDSESPVANPEELFGLSSEELAEALPERIDHKDFSGFVRLIERRIVGQDWLQSPRDPIDGVPPVVVFASHKGGVGRSTALAVAAAAFSQAGRDVLVIDLDLEAPGLGDMLLTDLPRWGTLDFFVEGGVQDLDDAFFDDMIGTTPFASRGLVHVAPAVGLTSEKNPQNVLGKISRAYLEHAHENDQIETFLDRTRHLVQRLTSRNRYDAVFIDARAGLNEATAAAILGLGGEVLLLGVDTPQTFSGYAYFLAHLAKFRPEESGDSDWRYRLRLVHAKAQANPEAQAHFRTEAFDVFSRHLYDVEEGLDQKALNFDYDDKTAPHFAWPILNDSNFSEFNPIARADQFSEYVYDRTFGPFVKELAGLIGVSL